VGGEGVKGGDTRKKPKKQEKYRGEGSQAWGRMRKEYKTKTDVRIHEE